MKIYTFSVAWNRLAAVMEGSKRQQVIIRRRRGDAFVVSPKNRARRSPSLAV